MLEVFEVFEVLEVPDVMRCAIFVWEFRGFEISVVAVSLLLSATWAKNPDVMSNLASPTRPGQFGLLDRHLERIGSCVYLTSQCSLSF